MEPATPSSPNVFKRFANQAQRRGAAIAIAFGDQRLSYETLLAQVQRASGHLAALGVGRGDRVAAFAQNRPELMVLYYAAARLGAVYVPINPNLTQAEVTYSVQHSGAKILFHDELVGETARHAVPVDIARPLNLLSSDIAIPPAADVAGDDDFLVIYTSGTTGTPKAILLDHAAQVRAAEALSDMWAITEADVTLVALPLGYLYGLSTGAAVGLQSGGRVVILRRFYPRDVLEGIVAHGATVFHGVPTMFSMMLDFCEQNDLRFDLSGTRELICAGALLPLEMRRRFAERFGKALQNYYAMTEATPVFGKYSRDPDPIPEDAVGRAAPGLNVRIVRPDHTECAIGEQGEILVRAAATMKAYLNAPEQTAAAFVGGLFRSGDLGHRDQNGNYFITGRLKDIIIRGGANISPSQVESVLADHPAIQYVAVVGAPDRIYGEVPVAFIVLRHGAVVTPDELVAHATVRLSEFKVPRRYQFETALPIGKTGKVDKAALKARISAAKR
jgi:long-chain acyl-CoA synthetase